MANPWNKIIRETTYNILGVFSNGDPNFYELYHFGYGKNKNYSNLIDKKYMNDLDGDITWKSFSVEELYYIIFKQNKIDKSFPKIQIVKYSMGKGYYSKAEKIKTITHKQIRDLTDFTYHLISIKNELNEYLNELKYKQKQEEINRRKYEILSDTFINDVEEFSNEIVRLEPEIKIESIFDNSNEYGLLYSNKSFNVIYNFGKNKYTVYYDLSYETLNLKINFVYTTKNLSTINKELEQKYFKIRNNLNTPQDVVNWIKLVEYEVKDS